MRQVSFKPKDVPKDILDSLYKYLCLASSAHGGIDTGMEAKRRFFIDPILVHLIELFKRDGVDGEILVDQNIPGKNIHVTGQFEFVITRGNKKVCIVEVKKGDFRQGTAQTLLGCEAVSDTETTSHVYGIATNYLVWVFFRSLDEKIEKDLTTLSIESGINAPTREGVGLILGKIYGLLSQEL